MTDLITVQVPRSRELAISYLRACLRDGGVFPSAAMQWLAEALDQAREDLAVRDVRHAELLASAAMHAGNLAARQRDRDDAHYADIGLTHYTVIIPYAAQNATEWHPTERTGPFSTLQRGAFRTQEEAYAWVDIYSCKPFDVNRMTKVVQRFLGDNVKKTNLIRRIAAEPISI